LPGDARGVLFTKNVVFHTFWATGTARRYLPHLWALGATIFSGFRSFRKTAFSDSLTV